MNTFLTSNTPLFRLLRTIVQGIIGVIIANADVLVGGHIAEPYKAVIVALVMAILSPVMASIGGDLDDDNGNQE
jgi:hypothetical protein